jgi:hypothetical protein
VKSETSLKGGMAQLGSYYNDFLKDERRTSNIERPTSNEKKNSILNTRAVIFQSHRFLSPSFPIQHTPVSSSFPFKIRCWMLDVHLLFLYRPMGPIRSVLENNIHGCQLFSDLIGSFPVFLLSCSLTVSDQCFDKFDVCGPLGQN